jgi:hypothetical protein
MKKQKPEPEQEGERIPFDDALRRILAAPPVHKTAKKTKPKKGRREGGR